MIKIEDQGENTKIQINGNTKNLYNEFKALIRSLYMKDNKDIREVFLRAWDSVIKEKEND